MGLGTPSSVRLHRDSLSHPYLDDVRVWLEGLEIGCKRIGRVRKHPPYSGTEEAQTQNGI